MEEAPPVEVGGKLDLEALDAGARQQIDRQRYYIEDAVVRPLHRVEDARPWKQAGDNVDQRFANGSMIFGE